jgi:iron(III) transport system permease protein
MSSSTVDRPIDGATSLADHDARPSLPRHWSSLALEKITSRLRYLVTPVVLLICGGLVLYPMVFVVAESFNDGEPGHFPPTSLTLDNYTAMFGDLRILTNTAFVAALATAMAILIGFTLAWILTRTAIPGRALLERLMGLPYYMTPLVGALSWAVLAGPKTGLANQLWHLSGGTGDLVNVYSPFGIAWVMALFEGTVAFVMISAAMKSMDSSLEEASRVMGGGKLRTIFRVTLPMVAPGVLSATVFVFAEMLGSFAAAFVLGIPSRFFVITTVIWEETLSFPPDYGRAAATGLFLFLIMLVTLTIARLILRKGSYATISGKAFRPRAVEVGRLRWALQIFCWGYVTLAVFLPFAALLLTSFQRLATVIWSQTHFTLANYRMALQMGTIGPAFANSLILGLSVATIAVFVVGILVWIIYRSRTPGSSLVEYVVMFPQAVPRMVFGLGLLWAWLNIPIPIYGTLWLLGLAYFTVFLPLGVRTLAGVVLQIDPGLEECARVCGASWLHQMKTVTLPLMRPGLAAAWLLIFIASVRELGVSIFLMGPNAKVIAPQIVNSWLASSSELSAAMAVLQTATVFLAVLILFRSLRKFHGGIV